MRRARLLRNGLAGGLVGTLAASTLLAFAMSGAATGCANSGGSPTFAAPDASPDTTPPALDATAADGALPDSTVRLDTGTDTTIAPQADSGGQDVVDAAEDIRGEVGAPCDASQATQTEPCGICGTRTSTCEGQPEKWSAYGACAGELPGGCTPDATFVDPCGLCGTRTRVCASDCEFAVSACTGQVPGGCYPGASMFVPQPSCSDASLQGTLETCSGGCTWAEAGSPCQAAPTSLVAAQTAGAIVDTVVDFVATSVIQPLENDTPCPQSLTDAGAPPPTPYAYVTVKNGSASAPTTVSIWTSQTPMGPTLDTMITTYQGGSPPVSDLARDRCVNEVTDTCDDMSDPTSCLPGWGGLMIGDGNAVTIGAGGSIVVYVAAANPGELGLVRLSVRTESMQ